MASNLIMTDISSSLPLYGPLPVARIVMYGASLPAALWVAAFCVQRSPLNRDVNQAITLTGILSLIAEMSVFAASCWVETVR